jgi:hypothetical protein
MSKALKEIHRLQALLSEFGRGGFKRLSESPCLADNPVHSTGQNHGDGRHAERVLILGLLLLGGIDRPYTESVSVFSTESTVNKTVEERP